MTEVQYCWYSINKVTVPSSPFPKRGFTTSIKIHAVVPELILFSGCSNNRKRWYYYHYFFFKIQYSQIIRILLREIMNSPTVGFIIRIGRITERVQSYMNHGSSPDDPPILHLHSKHVLSCGHSGKRRHVSW
jgi:hypothetical protein